MLKAIKVRIYPTDEQAAYISRQLGCCRFVYNNCLAYKSEQYKTDNVSVRPTELVNRLVGLKTEYEWLKDVHSKVLQQSVMDLNKAFDSFFKNKGGYPKFKRRDDNDNSCRFPKDAFIGVRGNRIDLTRALKDIHYKCSRKDEKCLNKYQKDVKNVTLRKLPCGQLYLSILIDRPNESRKHTDKCVGIDLGVKDFLTTSDGEVFSNLHFKKSETDRLKRLQRQISRKVKGSKNREKARVKCAKLNKKISDRKEHYLHEVSNRLIDENQVICMEDLNVKGMMRNHKLAESVGEMNFGEFRRILTYKSEWYGRELVFVDRFYPSSKTCGHCGYVNKGLKLSDRQWVCPECGETIDRDYNAACNILNEGLRIIGLSSPEFTLADYPTVDDRLSDEALKSGGRVKQEKHEFH